MSPWPDQPAPAARRVLGPVLALCALALLFVGLGVWQVHRLGEKIRLIAETDAAVHAAPIDPAILPPGDITPFAYRRLAMTGHFLPAGTILVTENSVWTRESGSALA